MKRGREERRGEEWRGEARLAVIDKPFGALASRFGACDWATFANT
jgi:hypothetical protein